MPSCELCDELPADQLVGLFETDARDPERSIRLDATQVKRVCAQCADSAIKRGVAREVPFPVGNAHELWGSDKFRLLDNEGRELWISPEPTNVRQYR